MQKLDSITMEEMLELAGQGAKVMQTRAVEFANKYNVSWSECYQALMREVEL